VGQVETTRPQSQPRHPLSWLEIPTRGRYDDPPDLLTPIVGTALSLTFAQAPARSTPARATLSPAPVSGPDNQPSSRTPPQRTVQRLIHAEKIALLRWAADLAAGQDAARKFRSRKIIEGLLSHTAELDLLLTYARAFHWGHSLARDRFAAILNQVVQRDVAGRRGGAGCVVRAGQHAGGAIRCCSGRTCRCQPAQH